MNKEEFISELKNINVNCNSEILEKVDMYYQFLREYNEHTNLTRITQEQDVYLKHFYDSLTICKVYDFYKASNLIDLGTGAGFPGMVLKIFFPHLKVTLLDSNNKKTKFLELLSRKLNIDVEIINDRVENYSKKHLNEFDIVTSRAVANLRVLAELSLPLVKENGYFIPLKGNIDEELEEAKETIDLMNGIIKEKKTFELYQNNGVRNILVVQKVGKTSIEKVRTYDKILKKPLKKK